ncbi:MAG: ATP-binding protein [Elusimicrobiota bacterium]
MLLKRIIQDKIEKLMFRGKVIIVYGPRQVGKTTLIKQIEKKYEDISLYLNCDEPDIQEIFSKTSTQIKSFFGNKRLILIDEAQQIKNIGQFLKLVSDNFKEIQIIVTGSSSFELSEKIIEPLTGRKYEFVLYPLSLVELKQLYSDLEIKRLVEEFMIYGMYPEILLNSQEREINLKSIARSYSYKDVLKFQNIKNPEVLDKLLKALALQIGNEVSYNELAQIVGVDKNTVSSYLQILEKAFIIYRIGPFSRNIRNEIKKLRKVFFLDTGIRNALINNLNDLSIRNDVGNLWENFWIIERIKYLEYFNYGANYYYWRTKQGQEIDFLEEYDGKIHAYELKWKSSKIKIPSLFVENYKESEFNVVNRENFLDFFKL